MMIRRCSWRGAGSGLAGLAGLGALAALLLGGCADTSTLQNDDELVKKREAIIKEEYEGNEIPMVDLQGLPDVSLLVPPSAADAYLVNPRVGVEGDYYIFNIHTRHGTYMVKSEMALVKYCYEAGVLEMFLNSKHGKTISEGMAEYLKESGDGAVDLVLHPVDSVRGIGRSFEAKTDAARGEVVKKINKQPDDRSHINRDVLPGGPLISAEVLKAAYQLRVDAYTLNPNMQALLVKLARDKEIGRIFLSGVTFLIPGSSVLSISNEVAAWSVNGMAPGGGSRQVEELISKTAPDELLVRIANFYQQHIGLESASGSAVMTLMGNSLYSPRMQAYIAYYLDEMKSAAGLPETVEYLAKTQSGFAAAYNTVQIEMLHAMHVEYGSARAIVPMTDQIGMLNTSGQFIVIPLWDHTRNREHVRNLLIEALKMGKRLGSSSTQVWFIGDCDQNTIQTASAAGIQVRRNVILDQTFRFTSLRKLSYKRKNTDPIIDDAGTVLPDSQWMPNRPSKRVIPGAPQPAPAPEDLATPAPAPAPAAAPESSATGFNDIPFFGGSAGNTADTPKDKKTEAPARAPSRMRNAPANTPAPQHTLPSEDVIPGIDNTAGLGE